jgi:hypothetical protein
MVELDSFGYLPRIPAAKALVYHQLAASLYGLRKALDGMPLAKASADAAQVQLAMLLRAFGDSLAAAQRAVDGEGQQVIDTLTRAHSVGSYYAEAKLLGMGLVGWIDPFTGRLRVTRDEETAQRVPQVLKAICQHEGMEDKDVAWHRCKRFVTAYGDALLWALRPPDVEDLCKELAALPAAMPKALGLATAIGLVQRSGALAVALDSPEAETRELPKGPPPPRVAVDLPCKTITLDGATYDVASENALLWVQVLAERPGEWISGPELCKRDPRLLGARTDRLRKHLPAAILAVIDSDRGKGSRIRL